MYGLAAAVWTKDIDKAFKFAKGSRRDGLDQQLPRGGDAGRAAGAVRWVQAKRDRAGAGAGGDGDVYGDEVGFAEAELAVSCWVLALGAVCGPPLCFGASPQCCRVNSRYVITPGRRQRRKKRPRLTF